MVVRWCVVLCVVSACGDNLQQSWAAEPCQLTWDFADVRLQAFSSDGRYLAFIADNSFGYNRLYVTETSCAGTRPKLADDIVSAWFCGSTLLAFPRQSLSDVSPALFAWNPDRGLAEVATNVDPTATHCSPDHRYFTTEANDLLGDGNPTVDLVLFDAATLSPIKTVRYDRPRGRFTHDSKSLLIAGDDILGANDGYWLSRYSIADGTMTRIAPIEHSRFAITKDDRYVVFTRPGLVVRVSLETGTEEVLATDLDSVPGRDLLLGDDDLVAYIGGANLQVVPVTGGPAKKLAPASSLVAHIPGLILYQGADGLGVATTAGHGFVVKDGVVEDSTSERVLLAGGSERFLITMPSFAIQTLPARYLQAALTHDNRVVALEPDTSIDYVTRYNGLVPASSGRPFMLDEQRRTLAVLEYTAPSTSVHVVRIDLP